MVDALESNEVKAEKTYTIFNGQLMQYTKVSDDSITVKLSGLDTPLIIEKEDSNFTHYKEEYDMLLAGMIAQREQAKKAKADAVKANLEIVD